MAVVDTGAPDTADDDYSGSIDQNQVLLSEEENRKSFKSRFLLLLLLFFVVEKGVKPSKQAIE